MSGAHIGERKHTPTSANNIPKVTFQQNLFSSASANFGTPEETQIAGVLFLLSRHIAVYYFLRDTSFRH